MSSERRRRLVSLVEELEALERRLADRETPEDALDLLDRLVRCEAFPAGELRSAGGGPILEAATRYRSEHASTLASLAAAGLELEGLLERAYFIITASERGERTEVLGWAEEILRLANVTPHLDEDTQRRAAEVIEEVLRLVEATPFAFVETADLAKERRAQEHPQKIRDTLGVDLLDAFAEAEELAAYDREHTTAGVPSTPGRAEAAGPRGAHVSYPDFGSSKGALGEEEGSRIREPLLLAAETKDYGIGEHALLRRIEEGELVLTRIGETHYVDWYGEGTPSLSLQEGGALRALPSQPIEDGLRWQLPRQAVELHLEARIGEKRVELVISA